MPIEPFFFVNTFYYLEIYYTINLSNFHFICYLWTDYFNSLFFFIQQNQKVHLLELSDFNRLLEPKGFIIHIWNVSIILIPLGSFSCYNIIMLIRCKEIHTE